MSYQGVTQDSKATFWKKSSRTVPGSIASVYGAQYPPRQEPFETNNLASSSPRKDGKAKTKDKFRDFQENTIDAWDDGEDDLLTMNPQVVQSTALQVLNNHSMQLAKVKAMQNQTMSRLSQNSGRSEGGGSSPGGATSNSGGNASGQRPNSGGPGLGVRLTGWQQPPRTSPKMHDRTSTTGEADQDSLSSKETARVEKFKALLESTQLNIDELKELAWSGVPKEFRPTTWKILSGYLPPSLDRRKATLERKRQEYTSYIQQYYETRHDELHKETFRQIAIDIPRMSPLIPIFQQRIVQEIFERILYIWAIRHPASGYVQGINDLVTPFFVVFLSEYISNDVEIENCDLSELPAAERATLEADSYWCYTKLLDFIQENYTFAQPGIQKKVAALKELVTRIDLKLHKHLEVNSVEYLQFSFRWMNNLLMREMPLRCIIRLWDTCLAEEDGFSMFYLYICAAFLTKFSEEIQRERDFQGIMLLLQNMRTHHWNNEHIGLLLAEAFKLKYMFAGAPRHLVQKPS